MSRQERRERQSETGHIAAGNEIRPPAGDSPPERRWIGCVMVREGSMYRWARVSLPQSVLDAHAIEVYAPDLRSRVTGLIENAMLGDGTITGRGWEPKT